MMSNSDNSFDGVGELDDVEDSWSDVDYVDNEDVVEDTSSYDKGKLSSFKKIIILILVVAGGAYSLILFGKGGNNQNIPVVNIEAGQELPLQPQTSEAKQALSSSDLEEKKNIYEDKGVVAVAEVVKPVSDDVDVARIGKKIIPNSGSIGDDVLTPMPNEFSDDNVVLADLEASDLGIEDITKVENPFIDNDTSSGVGEPLPLAENDLLSKTEVEFDNNRLSNNIEKEVSLNTKEVSDGNVIENNEQSSTSLENSSDLKTEILSSEPKNIGVSASDINDISDVEVVDITADVSNISLETTQEPKEVRNVALSEENIIPSPLHKPSVLKEKISIAEKKVTQNKKQVKTSKKVNWVIRAAQSGSAVIYNKNSGEMKSVEVNDIVIGVGRITSIEIVNGKWVIIGTSGKIRQQ